VYNGVDAAYFRELPESAEISRASLGIGRDAIVIGCVAQLRQEKSHRDLLAALEVLVKPADSNIVLLLVGDGSEEQQLRGYVETHKLSEHVRFCGSVRDVRPYLAVMDVFAMASSTEVFSNAILEAMATGLPVVCTAVGGSVEMVVDGETGITYPRFDVDSLVQALQVLVADQGKREQFGWRGAARAKEMFSIERMDEFYTKIMSGSSNPKDPD
jgi:glycosyltransferase involved in cell wall biosynthesis